MAKVKYYYDTKTLSYKRIELSGLNKLKRLFYFLTGSAFTGLIMIIVFFQFFDSPKEKRLNREIDILTSQYEIVEDKLSQVELVLDDIQNRDDNIYRVIFEAEPIQNLLGKQDMEASIVIKTLKDTATQNSLLTQVKKLIKFQNNCIFNQNHMMKLLN